MAIGMNLGADIAKIYQKDPVIDAATKKMNEAIGECIQQYFTMKVKAKSSMTLEGQVMKVDIQIEPEEKIPELPKGRFRDL